MDIACKHCGKHYDVPDERLPAGKIVKFPCPACKNIIRVDLRYERQSDRKEHPGSAKATSNEDEVGRLKRKILKSVGDLPPMPQVVQKARKVMANPNSSFKDLAIIFVTDQAIATRVLKMANSAYYGLAQRVSSIQQASVVLGHKTLAELITVASTSDLMGKELKGYGLEAGALWQHSLAVAFGSRLIAKKKDPEIADDAFAAGLIHDAGKLVLDPYVFERRDAFEDFLANDHENFLAAEKAILGFDHAEIASEICKRWNVPDNMATAIRYHHGPSEAVDEELAHVLHVADGIAMLSGLGTGVDALSYEIDEQAIKTLGLKSNEVSKLAEQVVASVQNTIHEFQ
ncbi:MAG: zinc-ribbon domain-containing protein [Deltaproteobacteria bacterium]|nr:zinc-ribbon domain-containing protein [Deltaproteobacteria bacterium]